MHQRHVVLGALLIVGTVAGCKGSGPAISHESLSSIASLRAAFNADSGKVRAIFLASPT